MKILNCFVIILTLSAFSTNSFSQGLARIGVDNLQNNGWHLAKSTGGDFSVELPSIFNDVTLPSNLHMLGTTLDNGTKYAAIFAPNGTNAGIFRKFNEDLENDSSTISRYKGFTTIYSKQKTQGSDGVGVNVMMRVKSKKGIYLLVISAPIKYSSDAEKNRSHFFNSLSF